MIGRYQLTKKETFCPECQHKKYKRYIDTLTGELLPEQYGRCNRQNTCGYECNPYRDQRFLKEWETDSGTAQPSQYRHTPPPSKPVQVSPLVPLDRLFERYMQRQRDCALYQYLCGRYGQTSTDYIMNRYGCTSSASGATIFWNIDTDGVVHTGKGITYKQGTHHRDKNIAPFWVHSKLIKAGALDGVLTPEQRANYDARIQPFGLHRVRDEVFTHCAIVESEKTAIVCALEYFTTRSRWLFVATGGASNRKAVATIVKECRQRHITPLLIPDNDAAGQRWNEYATEFGLKVSHITNSGSTSADLADMILGE